MDNLFCLKLIHFYFSKVQRPLEDSGEIDYDDIEDDQTPISTTSTSTTSSTTTTTTITAIKTSSTIPPNFDYQDDQGGDVGDTGIKPDDAIIEVGANNLCTGGFDTVVNIRRELFVFKGEVCSKEIFLVN